MSYPKAGSHVGETANDFSGFTWRWTGEQWVPAVIVAGVRGDYQAHHVEIPEVPTTADFEPLVLDNLKHASSYFYRDGDAADTVQDIDAGSLVNLKYTRASFRRASAELTDDMYDDSTGKITLSGVNEDQFLQVNFTVEVETELDNGSAYLVLESTTYADDGAETNSQEIFLGALNNGAGTYPLVATFPIPININYSDDGVNNAAELQPKLKLVDTGGTVRPINMSIYLWN